MKSRLLSGWNFIRGLWLIIGIGIGVQAITEKNYLMLIPSLYFVFSSIANIGCCASGSCATDFRKRNKKESATEIEFEEIQSKK